ncbi:MAG: ATP-binding protein [Eubacteriales bacterium]
METDFALVAKRVQLNLLRMLPDFVGCRGGTGLGKTHLSLAIAHEAIEKGTALFMVLAQKYGCQFRKRTFSKRQ